jgi:hypothetical protein
MIITNTNLNIDAQLVKLQPKTNKAWLGSKNESYKKLTNQKKGKFGVVLIQELLQNNGYQAEMINDEGDLKYRESDSDEWTKVEVKTAGVNMDGKWNAWFNQIRPNQESWREVWLVSVFPNHIRIYKKSREDFVDNISIMESTRKCLTHYGTDDLAGANLTDENESEWNCIYNNQQGDLL